MSDSLLTVTNLTVKFGNNTVLDHLSFSVKTGDTLAVIGPNGAGKTVLFRALLGLVPYTGTVTWGNSVKIGYVPQRLSIETSLPLTVREFFQFKSSHPKEVASVLTQVGFTSDQSLLLNNTLSNLSGGQLQRVLIAWSLVDHPTVLLFDEPTTGVDISAEESIYTLLHRLQDQHKLTIILISHELQVVYRYATNVLCLNKEGLCFGPPHQALTPDALSKLFGEDMSIYHHQHHV